VFLTEFTSPYSLNTLPRWHTSENPGTMYILTLHSSVPFRLSSRAYSFPCLSSDKTSFTRDKVYRLECLRIATITAPGSLVTSKFTGIWWTHFSQTASEHLRKVSTQKLAKTGNPTAWQLGRQFSRPKTPAALAKGEWKSVGQSRQPVNMRPSRHKATYPTLFAATEVFRDFPQFQGKYQG